MPAIMTPNDELRQVVASLQAALRRADLTQREVSSRLGQHPNYLSQVFAGKTRLREDVVVSILSLLGCEIHEFYAELGREKAPPAEVEGLRGPVSAEEARRFIREALDARGEARRTTPRPAGAAVPGAVRATGHERHCERVLELLRIRIRQAGLRQREISRALGEHPDYLSQVLRGNVALKTELVLAVIRLLGSTPAAFYAELAGARLEPRTSAAASHEVARGVTWGEILALIDEEIESSLERKAQQPARTAPLRARPSLSRRALRAS